jgi:Arc/MetJ-type ribon-helix-helix transcriptional regulator
MTIEITNPEDQNIIRTKLQNGEFQSVDELIHNALVSLPSTTARSETPGKTRAEAVNHIREARKGNLLPAGVTIRDLIDKNRA